MGNKLKPLLKKALCLIVILGVCLPYLPMPFTKSVEAAAGDTIYGDYVLVLNKNPDNTSYQSTGSIVFDSSGTSAAPVINPNRYDGAAPITGSTNRTGVKKAGETVYTVGQQKNLPDGTWSGMPATCVAVGEHCYIWMENSLKTDYDTRGVTAKAAAELISVYEAMPYRTLSEMANGSIPCNDGSGKLSIVMEIMNGASGYYVSDTTITAIHVDVPEAADYDYGDFSGFNGLLSHEGQHALFFNFICNKTYGYGDNEFWINEGLSTAAMDYTWGGADSNGFFTYIKSNTSIRNGAPLRYQYPYRGDFDLDYAFPYLFVRYLADQYTQCYDPMDFIKLFYKYKTTNYSDIDAYLEAVMAAANLKDADGNALTFEKALENFYIACVAQNPTGVYGFYNDAPLTDHLGDYPIYLGTSGQAVDLYGTGALILKTKNGSFTIPQNAGEDIVFVAFNKSAASGMPEGSGTQEYPYLITNAKELFTIYKQPDKYYKLMANIDLSDTTYVTVGDFSGTLDGNGYTITGLKNPLVNENNGTIKYLSLDINFDEEYSYYAGGIAEYNNGKILDCSVTGSITGYMFGGFWDDVRVGGIAAINSNAGEIERCWANIDINPSVPLDNCYIGGIVGENNGRILNAYSKGTITVNQPFDGVNNLFVGGIAGRMRDTYWVTTLKNTYSVMSINVTAPGASLTKYYGRLIGGYSYTRSNVIDSNYALSGMAAAGNSGGVTSFDAASKTEAELKTRATFTGWDFDAIWKMTEGATTPTFITNEDLGDITAHIDKTEYYTGERLDLFGAYITVNGSNINITSDMLNPYSTDTAGTLTVSGAYMQKPFSFNVNVTRPTAANISSLSVYSPAKSSYVEGQSFDSSALVLAALINGQTRYIYSAYTHDKPLALTTSDTGVTYTYCGKTVSQNITVIPKAPASMAVTSTPAKTSYTSGDMLDLTGLSVQITYNDGTQSSVIAYRYFKDNGIFISRAIGSELSAFDEKKTSLTVGDNGADFYVYTGADYAHPTSYAYITGITVVSPPYFAAENTIRLTLNKDNWIITEKVQGGSGDFSAALISGTLPAGITPVMPSAYNDYKFEFNGTPTAVGSYTLTYRITDTVTGRTTDTVFNLNVTAPSSECLIESFVISKALNSGKISEDVIGITDNTASTVTLYFPANTDISSISANVSVSEGASLSPINGTNHNYTINPAIYTVTAEDGVTQKIYTVTALRAATDETLGAPSGLNWNARAVEFDPVTDASGYTVRLYAVSEDSIELISSQFITSTALDLSSYMNGMRSYKVMVNAVDGTGTRAASPAATSPVFTPVTAIDIYASKYTLPLNETLDFTSEVLPAGASISAVTWSVTNGTGSATISQSGVVTPVSEGTVTVTAAATDGSGITASKTVTITGARPTSFTVSLTPPSGYTNANVYLDGEKYTATAANGTYSVTTDGDAYKSAVMYEYNANNIPVGMYVWLLSFSEEDYTYTATPQPALKDLLSYHGFSVRVKGVSGIRFKTGISATTRASLVSSAGLDGFKLSEYGTCVMTNANRAAYEFVKGGEKVSSGRSYWVQNGSVSDFIFETKAGRHRFTSVLINIAARNYKTDYAFRGYIVLEKNGELYTIYGPPMYRSIYTVAQQVLAAGEFPAGSQADLFLRQIITDADNNGD